jgi:GNAT superfamily N-acetyltransferase
MTMDLAHIARLEEYRQAESLSEIAGEWLEIGGGRAARGPLGIWANIAMAMGLDGPVSRDEIERTIEWYTSAGVEPRFEVCPYVHPEFLRECENAGLVVRAFENIFWQPLERGRRIPTMHDTPPDLKIITIDRSDPAACAQYGECIARGFAPAGAEPPAADIDAYTRVAAHRRTTAMLAILDGRCIGGGATEVAGEIATLYAMSVLPEFRRRGIQQALMAARLEYAASQDARFATIGARPAIATGRNALRMGFSLAYTKVVLVKPAPGLAQVRH